MRHESRRRCQGFLHIFEGNIGFKGPLKREPFFRRAVKDLTLNTKSTINLFK